MIAEKHIPALKTSEIDTEETFQGMWLLPGMIFSCFYLKQSYRILFLVFDVLLEWLLQWLS